ncbi:YedE family putative selenium transporter [Lachnoanaerobaculum gingivalis]|uniref:YedE family putative selenium transporter n=1 Tax=Lachnoanaerobaculum gingivalis TaxID=2490855 RepID=UPI0024A65C3F|nr:YedE family putative selenium transporter [Lachnoanaerobaculum gingivalis]WHE87349.1 YedE family putative selenium transporter [Lachnoanaerobaculum gingivalis]
MKNEKIVIGGAGIIIGIIAVVLVMLGNPANMGFCIACFIRDTAGGLGLHRAEPVQYIRPEIMGLILGAFGVAFGRKEFSVKGGSSPLLRFVIGFFVMIGCLMFLGCPFRMILRIAGGDLNAIVGLVGFACGIGAGIVFLNKGYSLGRTYKQEQVHGFVMPIVQIVLLVLVIVAPAFIFFTPADGGPGAKHAAVIVSLVAGLIVGGLAQYTRLCMVGGIRDFILFRETRLLIGFVAILIAALIGNLVIGKFNLGFLEQPVAHNDGLWNFLGMLLAGYGCCLLGGCPLRQLVLTGEGNTDSAVTFLGLFAGAAFAHNFALAASGKGPSANGKIAVIVGLVVVTIIALANTMKKENT